jgi:hypothetical protein
MGGEIKRNIFSKGRAKQVLQSNKECEIAKGEPYTKFI